MFGTGSQGEKLGAETNMPNYQFFTWETGFQGDRLGLITNIRPLQFINWQGKQERVTYEVPLEIEQIVDFLNQNLQEGQTFYDFTDAPELFVLSQKEHLLYITPPHLNLSDEHQNVTNSYLQDAYDENKLAYVIFKQGLQYDKLDSVPRELVSYRTAEFIYHNFHPVYQVGRFEVWKANFLEPQPDKLAGGLFESLDFLDLESIQQNDVTITQNEHQGALQISANELDPFIYNFLDLSEMKVLEKDEGFYLLKITYRAELEVDNDLQVFYAFEGEGFSEDNSIISDLRESSNGDDRVLVIKLNQTINHTGQRLEALRFDFPQLSQVNVEKVEYLATDIDLYSENFFPENKTSIYQQFDLVKLPYIWGTFDEKDAVHTTEVLQTLVNEKIQFKPNEPQTFLIDPMISKENGNYIHLRIRANEKATIKLYYTNPEESYFAFNTIHSDLFEDYLVRVSTQWQWMSEDVNELVISSSGNLVISELYVREGD